MNNIMENMDKEDYRKPSGDEGEVVFSQQEEGAAINGASWPKNRSTERKWLAGRYGAIPWGSAKNDGCQPVG